MAESLADDQGTSGTVSSAGNEREFSLRMPYIKDLSFEAPYTLGPYENNGVEPEISLNLRTSSRELGENIREVVLHVDVHALSGERTVFLLELAQAGRFRISGFSKEELRTLIGVACPTALFPYAREAVSSMIQRGGFPAVLLRDVDFAALFSEAQANRAARTPPAGQA
jgi:preprotein translocase subunit SecB